MLLRNRHHPRSERRPPPFPARVAPVLADSGQSEDEVGLLELDPFGVDPHEDLGDLVFLGGRPELDDLEREVAQVADPVDPLLQLVLTAVVQVGSCDSTSLRRNARTVGL